MRKIGYTLVSMLLMVGMLAGCGKAESKQKANTEPQTEQQDQQTKEEQAQEFKNAQEVMDKVVNDCAEQGVNLTVVNEEADEFATTYTVLIEFPIEDEEMDSPEDFNMEVSIDNNTMEVFNVALYNGTGVEAKDDKKIMVIAKEFVEIIGGQEAVERFEQFNFHREQVFEITPNAEIPYTLEIEQGLDNTNIFQMYIY